MRRSQWQHSDDANLQADVMRFMAIVAFCLIAILAMVRNISPPSDAAQTAQLAQAQPPAPKPAEPAPKQAQPAPVDDVVQPPPAQALVEPIDPPPTSSPAPALPPPETLAATPRPSNTSPATQPQPEQPVPSPVAANAAASPSDEDPGLTLRFSSQGDFLRLVAKGKVDVYAYGAETFLSMDKSYRFHESAPPKQVYELEPSGIPQPMQAALSDTHAAQPFTWAVGLPPRVERQIQNYLRQQATGQLLINRFEQVRHVETP